MDTEDLYVQQRDAVNSQVHAARSSRLNAQVVFHDKMQEIERLIDAVPPEMQERLWDFARDEFRNLVRELLKAADK